MPQPHWQWDQGPIGRIVKTGYITLRREIEQMLRPTGLTHTQWSALGVLLHYPGLTPSQLEQMLMIERPSVTSLMNGLENRGLIVRRVSPGDGRSKQIFLTDAGRKLAEETQHFARVVEEKVKRGMTKDEFETLKALLVKMVRIFHQS
jgi:DNA-binding MarR family transcriptional regulator